MNQEPQTTAIAQFQELPAIAANAGVILEKNKGWHDGAVNKAQGFLDTIESLDGEMAPKLYTEIVEFLIKVGVFKGKMNDGRSPLTQLFTAIAKEFTTLENDMDKAKDGTVMFKLQKALNDEVRRQETIKRQREEQIRREAYAKQERIDLTARIEQIVRDKYLEILSFYKRKSTDLFNSITIVNADQVETELKAIAEIYPENKFLEIAVPVISTFMDKAELAGLIFDTRKSLYAELSANFKENMQQSKMLLIDQIPARKQELTEIANAGAKEKKRLEEVAELRRKQAELDEAKEKQELERQQQNAIELNRDIQQAELSFSTDVANAEVHNESDMKSKSGYVIKVMTAAGWNQISTFWFQQFGNKTPIDKFDKKTFASMKGDIEKLALTTDGKTRIADSGHLVYELEYKAVIKK